MEKMLQHLKDRWLVPEKYTGITITPLVATFPLWNVSGKMVGYQTYNPSKPKTHNPKNPHDAKYFTYSTKNELAVWGLETVDWLAIDKPIFLTEGIFDAARLHYYGLQAIAVLGNNPKHLSNWLNLLPSNTVSVVQGDLAGKKLAKFGNFSIFLPETKDVGDLSFEQFELYFKKYYNNL